MQIAMALYPHFTVLDVTGPFQVLVDVPGHDVVFVAGETGGEPHLSAPRPAPSTVGAEPDRLTPCKSKKPLPAALISRAAAAW